MIPPRPDRALIGAILLVAIVALAMASAIELLRSGRPAVDVAVVEGPILAASLPAAVGLLNTRKLGDIERRTAGVERNVNGQLEAAREGARRAGYSFGYRDALAGVAPRPEAQPPPIHSVADLGRSDAPPPCP